MPTTTKVTKGNTLFPLNSYITNGNGDPIDLSAYTVKFRMVEKDDPTQVVVNDGTSGITAQPTQTFTASATTDRLTCNGHGVKAGQQIIVSTSSALPTGLSAATRYFATEVTPNSFKVSDTPNGAPIDITGAGTGTHSFYILGTVQWDWQSGDVDEAGEFYAWFKLFSGSEFQHVPYNGTDWLVIVEQSY